MESDVAQQPLSLSRGEANERAAALSVQRYDIDVDLTGLAEGDALRSRSTIRFSCETPGASTFADCVADVEQATLNGKAIEPAAVSNGRIALDDLDERNVLVVDSVQRATSQASGVHRSVDPTDGKVYVWMTFEPDDARRAWACFDQPDLKAPFGFTVTAPAAWTVTSNSADAAVERVGDARRWRFPDTPPLSTYVPVVNAGPFVEHRTERGGYDLGLLTRQSLAGFLERDAEELFDLTAAGLAFYGDRFALPFPQHKYDQVFVPDLGGAMENYGCITWSDAFLYRSAPSPAEREWRASVLLHEMAHMWFGDMVTMRWWDDLWLNESFATWAACWAATNATEWSDAWATFLASQKVAGYQADRSPGTHPIRQSSNDVAEATARFDDITYIKGASVLKQLVAYVGEEAFVDGLQAYFAKHKWGNATLDDLMTDLATASGRDLTGWTSDWLDRAGTDLITVRNTGNELAVTATAPDGGKPRPHRLNVGLYGRQEQRLVRRQSVPLLMDSGAAPLPPEAVDADLVLVNDDDLTFADVLPEAETLQALTSSAGLLPTPTGRALAVATAWNRLSTGDLTTSAFVECATSVLAVETADSVIEPFLHRALRAADLWATGDTRDKLLTKVADTCLAIASSGGERGRVALRSLARVATDDEHFTALEQAGEEDTELRWRTLSRLAELGRYDAEATEALRHRDPDPEAWARAVAVNAARPDAGAKEEAWRLVMEERRFPLSRPLADVSHAFWRPGHEEVLARYPDRYLAALPGLKGAGMLVVMSIAGAMFPLVAVDEGFAERALETAHNSDVSALLSKQLIDDVDQLKRMLSARARS